MSPAEIVIIGSGSLAEKVSNSLSELSLGPMRVALIGRAKDKVARMALVASARASILGVRAAFKPVELPQFNALAFSRVFRSLKPKIIFHAASLQSPWESAQGQSAWTQLISAAGFGITLPLQMALIAEVSRAASDSEAAIVNASYPDCVNLVLHQAGLRTTCGIGNSAIVESFCRAGLQANKADVRVIGHHGHLAPWLKKTPSSPLPRIWVKGREANSLRLSPQLDAIEEGLNEVTAATAVSVLKALLTGETLHISLPGAAGLPGGYPYVLRRGKFVLRLPAAIKLEDAIAHNKTGEQLDGLNISNDVKFMDQARQALASVGFGYAQGFAFADWLVVRDKMLLLRERLRLQPATAS